MAYLIWIAPGFFPAGDLSEEELRQHDLMEERAAHTALTIGGAAFVVVIAGGIGVATERKPKRSLT